MVQLFIYLDFLGKSSFWFIVSWCAVLETEELFRYYFIANEAASV